MKRGQCDQISGLIIIAFALIVYFILIPTQIPPDRMGLSSSFFPKFSAIVIAGLGVILFFKPLFSKNSENAELIFRMDRVSVIRAIIIFSFMVSYIFLLHFIGFLISTPLILAMMLYYSGQRNWRIILPLIIIVPSLLYSFFSFGMKLVLPQGILF